MWIVCRCFAQGNTHVYSQHIVQDQRFNHNTNNCLHTLNEPHTCLHLPSTCATCPLCWAPKYHTGAQRRLQDEKITSRSAGRCYLQGKESWKGCLSRQVSVFSWTLGICVQGRCGSRWRNTLCLTASWNNRQHCWETEFNTIQKHLPAQIFMKFKQQRWSLVATSACQAR